jgi:hypothetical protein
MANKKPLKQGFLRIHASGAIGDQQLYCLMIRADDW